MLDKLLQTMHTPSLWYYLGDGGVLTDQVRLQLTHALLHSPDAGLKTLELLVKIVLGAVCGEEHTCKKFVVLSVFIVYVCECVSACMFACQSPFFMQARTLHGNASTHAPSTRRCE